MAESTTLSQGARRLIGAGYVPRVKQPGEATPPANDLWKRDVLTARDYSDGRKVTL